MDKQLLQKIADTIRVVSMEAVQAANSGHPGLPMGCAEIAAVLWGKDMRYNPADPDWMGRDRFVLSAGHGSMLQYTALCLAGYDYSIEDLKNFRQWGSKTAGHPEQEFPGIETTTGPLGQGLATATGMALGQKMMAARYGVEGKELLDGQVYVLAGDGCMMEGITNESGSFAGHLKLDNLIVIYDANDICLDGPLTECQTEDTGKRYEALGWHVELIDGHDLDAVISSLAEARARKGKPSLIIAKTTIAKGSPNMAGTHKAHGAPLGEEECKATKKALGWPEDEAFHIPEEVTNFFLKHKAELDQAQAEWTLRFEQWAKQHPEAAEAWKAAVDGKLPEDLDAKIRAVEIGASQPGRKASNAVLQALHDLVPYFVGGSADLSCSDNTMMKGSGVVAPDDYAQRNIKYGVREFAMGAMNTGLALHGGFLPYCGTFFVFSDYMRNAIRLCAMMEQKTVYQLTHDSFKLGEDGPTHQPIEHLASLRAMPQISVFRPADSNEVKAAWSAALTLCEGPSAMVLSRQNMPDLEGTDLPTAEGVGRGGYVLREGGANPDYCLIATGSEVALAVEVAEALEGKGKKVRVVSMPCQELFDAQDAGYQDKVLGGAGRYVSIEAGAETGWHKYIGRDGVAIAMHRFGASAPAKVLAEKFGFTAQAVLEKLGE